MAQHIYFSCTQLPNLVASSIAQEPIFTANVLQLYIHKYIIIKESTVNHICTFDKFQLSYNSSQTTRET